MSTATPWWFVRALPSLLLACSGTQQTGPHAGPGPDAPVAVADPVVPTAATPPAASARVLPKLSQREHPAGHAWIFDTAAEPQKQEIAQAEAAGYTMIDLGNTWVPYIFSEKTNGQEDLSANEYRQRYIGLANDRVDADGEKLDPHERNFLELYGIPPSLAVVFRDWQISETEIQPCLEAAKFDPTVFARFTGVIAYTGKKGGDLRKARAYREKLAKGLTKAGLDPNLLEEAKGHPTLGSAYTSWRELQDRIDVIDHAQRRLRCEKMFVSAEGVGKFEPGVFDSATTHALAAFEKKHAVKGWGHFTPDNLAVLALPQPESMHRRLLRVVEERTVAGAGIIEDGSAARWKPKFRWTDSKGQEHALRDMVGEAQAAVVAALDLATPESGRRALAKLSELGGGDFEDLLVGVRLPPAPEYYGEHMAFDVVIDRGDVWYDFPFDSEGNRLAQPRDRYPHFTIYAMLGEQKIPLVHWRTTIGSWRTEMYNGTESYKYKDSDVGDRVWKEIVAAPVWIPPAATPPRELVRRKWKDGKVRTVVNYGEFGPSYTSAYGLVAAYHIKEIKNPDGTVKADFDNGIRTHGSVDYMSILRRYSHGCHRLYNMSAVRLFSFVLAHRDFVREGQVKLGFGREFSHEGNNFKLSLKTRGYRYNLPEPIPVHVLEGRIRGERKNPVEGYVPKPTPAPAPGDELPPGTPAEAVPPEMTPVGPIATPVQP